MSRAQEEPRPLPAGMPRALGALAQLLCKLPGVGEKTAQRFAVALVLDRSLAQSVATLVGGLHDVVVVCPVCNGFAERASAEDPAECALCRDPRRDDGLLCVVAKTPDLLAIERSGAMHGRYFVLGRMLDPLNGSTMATLPIDRLRAAVQGKREVLLALPPSVEGEATGLALTRELADCGARVTRIAQGVQYGAEIEFADQVTITSAIRGRVEIGGG